MVLGSLLPALATPDHAPLPVGVRDRATNQLATPATGVASQRGSWQAGLLLQSLHAMICAAGQQPEAGYTLVQTPDGTPTAGWSGGALQSFPRSYAWPFAHVDGGFTPTDP